MINNIFNLQNSFKHIQRLSSAKERIAKLDKIENWILSNRRKIKSALYLDFKKSDEETDITEVYPLVTEIRLAKRNLKKWIKKIRVGRSIVYLANSAFINYEAKGCVLIISPWNYPFQLAIGPLISAIAAGNVVTIKPSEISKNTSALISEMINELFEQNEVVVIEGDKNITNQLLNLPFDHIFFTGSTEVGKIIAKSSVEHLSSFTLELGGKSPVFIEESANLKMAADKIAWGKFLNKGQTCVAPDYILIDKKIRNDFVKLIIDRIQKFYGNGKTETENNKSYARIINQNHHQRIIEIINDSQSNGSEILYGGNYNSETNFIEPTIILTNCKNCKLSEEEIFGPILPIVEYENIDEAIEWINKRNPPISIYIFSSNKKVIKVISSSTQSGGIGINELVINFSHPYLPFGGVRQSGIGRSHGYSGFKTFSNERSYIQSSKLNLLKIIYPPYSDLKRKIIDAFVRYL